MLCVTCSWLYYYVTVTEELRNGLVLILNKNICQIMKIPYPGLYFASFTIILRF